MHFPSVALALVFASIFAAILWVGLGQADRFDSDPAAQAHARSAFLNECAVMRRIPLDRCGKLWSQHRDALLAAVEPDKDTSQD